MLWHVRLFCRGREHVEDRSDRESAKAWAQTKLRELGEIHVLDWKQEGRAWHAGFKSDLDVHVSSFE